MVGTVTPGPEESPRAISTSAPVTEPEPAANSASGAPSAEAKTFPPLKTPTIQEFRNEVARDPETTPPSLLRFAAVLGPRMEAALKSEDAAKALEPELEDCALARNGHGAIASVQATCLSDARKLGRAYPDSLGERAANLTSQADPSVTRLLSVLPADER